MNRELALYLAAGAAYIAVGVAVPELLLSWFEGAAFLLLAVWIVPGLLARARNFVADSHQRVGR
ncbi:MAG: hypothetical protein M3229_04080 [Actinomycetota bacterium]|nr:hypothetical protein [Actinomycetota bacterium]